MRVMMLGLRGFPGVQGGVESHVEHLARELSSRGCELEILVRSPYWSAPPEDLAPQVRFTRIWSPRTRGVEAFVHTFLGVLYAAIRRPDVLHIHAIGPALFTPVARAFGLSVVVTHHGMDYNREKWGRLARWVLRAGERLGMRFAHQRIAVSGAIRDAVHSAYGISCVHIPNGVATPGSSGSHDILEELGLVPGCYVLHVGRLVPEKRQLDLIRAFSNAQLGSWKLVLVGAADMADPYVRRVAEAAEAAGDVVLAGLRTGRALHTIFANAGLFALPSSHEGHPIALLEALSHGLPAIASDIDANREIGLPPDQYFRTGDVADLTRCLLQAVARGSSATDRERTRAWVLARYDWSAIAARTLEVYHRAVA